MNFNDIFNKLSFTKKATEKEKLWNNYYKQQLYRSKQDIQDYKNALQAAESLVSPNRQPLYRLYQNIADDGHLTSIVQSRKIKALSKTFRVVDAKGKELPEQTELLKAKWFQDFLELAFEADMYGYSLIQLLDIVDGVISGVRLVDREHVKPAQQIVVAQPGDNSGYDYTKNKWCVGVGSATNLGMYQKVAPLVLYKKHALAAYAQYVELFGMPLRVGKVNLAQTERADSMFKMLQEMNTAGFGVIDSEDVVEVIETTKTNGDVFTGFIDYLDSQISKLIWGQTMMSDDGSSRSQSEVHERLADDYSAFDLKNLRYVINDSLIPTLIGLGFTEFKNTHFEFYDVENTAETFTMVTELLKLGVYEIEDKWMSDKFGIPVKTKEVAPAPVVAPDKKGDTENFQ